ncbi:MAG: ATP-binding protein [Gemmatimonadota bacterium]
MRAHPRQSLSTGPLAVLVVAAGLLTCVVLALHAAWWEAALTLAVAVLAARLHWHVGQGRARERRVRDEVVLHARMLDAVGEAVVGCSPGSTITYWNRAAERLLGWRRAEAVGSDLTTVLPDLSFTEARHQPGAEAELRHRDGHTIPALVTVSPLDARVGQPTGWVLVLVDLTHQKSGEREQRVLAEVGAVLAAGLGLETTLSRVAHCALPTLGSVCLVDVVEDGAARRLHTLHAGRRSAALAEAVHGAAGAPVWPDDVLAAALAGEALTLNGPAGGGVLSAYGCHGALVVPLRAHGHTLALLSFLVGPERGPFGQEELALARELANRVAVALENARLLEEAHTATRSKADFLAVMSHELRTPLTAITGYADLLLGGMAEPVPRQALTYVQRMRGAAWHLLGIIEQILTFARLDEAREQVDPGRLALADFVRDTAALMEPVAAEKGVAFSAKAPGDGVTLVTDATRLRQILLNLLSNAVKFTDSGVVALTASLEGDMAVFEVRDTGAGIEAEHLEHIFEPFWQVDQSSARRAGGTGIGLSVAQRQARLLGGTITAASCPGEGTTFTLRIPAAWVPSTERRPASGQRSLAVSAGSG